jgi:hypothetical protein
MHWFNEPWERASPEFMLKITNTIYLGSFLPTCMVLYATRNKTKGTQTDYKHRYILAHRKAAADKTAWFIIHTRQQIDQWWGSLKNNNKGGFAYIDVFENLAVSAQSQLGVLDHCCERGNKASRNTNAISLRPPHGSEHLEANVGFTYLGRRLYLEQHKSHS